MSKLYQLGEKCELKTLGLRGGHRELIVSAWGKVRAQDVKSMFISCWLIVSAWGKVRAQDYGLDSNPNP